MQKAEVQQANAQSRPAAKQAGGEAFEAVHSEEPAQLETLIEFSPQMKRQGNLAAIINGNSAMTAQLRIMNRVGNPQQPSLLQRMADIIHNSPNPQAAQKFSDNINTSPMMLAQRKKYQRLFGVAERVEDEKPTQGKFSAEAPEQLEQQPSSKPKNNGLPDNIKSGIESLSGMSMDNVKVHYNSSQPAQLNALAYAQGTDIHVAPGQEQHLPHEAWHVVQQAQGRVKPTKQMKDGIPVNDDKGLELEADLMGAKTLQTTHHNHLATSSTMLQRRKREAALFSVQIKSQSKADIYPKTGPFNNLQKRTNQTVQRVPVPVGTGGKAYFDGDIPANLSFIENLTIVINKEEKQLKSFLVAETEKKVLFEPLTGLYYNTALELIPPSSIVKVKEIESTSGLDIANEILKDFCKIIKSNFVPVSKLPTTAIDGQVIKRLLIQVAIPDLLQLIQEAGRKKIADPDDFVKVIGDLVKLAKTTPTTQPELLQLLSDITVETSDMLVDSMPETPVQGLEELVFIHEMENRESAGKGARDVALNELAGDVIGTELNQSARKKIIEKAYHLGFNLSGFLKRANFKYGKLEKAPKINAIISDLQEENENSKERLLKEGEWAGIYITMEKIGLSAGLFKKINLGLSQKGLAPDDIHALVESMAQAKCYYDGESNLNAEIDFVYDQRKLIDGKNKTKVLEKLDPRLIGKTYTKIWSGIYPMMENLGFSPGLFDKIIGALTQKGLSLEDIDSLLKQLKVPYDGENTLKTESSYLLQKFFKSKGSRSVALDPKKFEDTPNLYTEDVIDPMLLDSVARAKKGGHTLPENPYIERHFTPAVMAFLASNPSVYIEIYEGHTTQALGDLAHMGYTSIIPFSRNPNTDFQQFTATNPESKKTSFVIVGLPGRSYQREIAAHFLYYNPPINPLRILHHKLNKIDASSEDFAGTLSTLPSTESGNIIVQMGNVGQVQRMLGEKGINAFKELAAPNLYGLAYDINGTLMISLKVEPFLYADRSGAFLRAIYKKYGGKVTVIFTGTAGALDQTLQVGDLVAPKVISQVDDLNPHISGVKNEASTFMSEKYPEKEKEGMISEAKHGAVDSILFEDKLWFQKYDKQLTIVEQEVAHLANAVSLAEKRTKFYALFRISDVLGQHAFTEEAIRPDYRTPVYQGDLVLQILEANFGKLEKEIPQKELVPAQKLFKVRQKELVLQTQDQIISISTAVFSILDQLDPELRKGFEELLNDIVNSAAKLEPQNLLSYISRLFQLYDLSEDNIKIMALKVMTGISCKIPCPETATVHIFYKVDNGKEQIKPMKYQGVWKFNAEDIKAGSHITFQVKIGEGKLIPEKPYEMTGGSTKFFDIKD